MANLLFATKLPSPTIVGVREEARRQRRNINTIVDAALRRFLNLPFAEREEFTTALPEPLTAAERGARGFSATPNRNRKKGVGK